MRIDEKVKDIFIRCLTNKISVSQAIDYVKIYKHSIDRHLIVKYLDMEWKNNSDTFFFILKNYSHLLNSDDMIYLMKKVSIDLNDENIRKLYLIMNTDVMKKRFDQ